MTVTGILLVDKAQGWTSHDVVGRVRRLVGQKQVGHAGTLDPLATGLLVVLLGRATKLSAQLTGAEKLYRAEVVLGATTVTDDAEAPIAQRLDPRNITSSDIELCLSQFSGEIEQVPPLYSAVRQGGKKLYALARKGVEVTPLPRRVCIHSITLERWEPPRLRLLVHCGAGTYLRSLARDLGSALGVGGYLHALRRLASGDFHLNDALTLDEIAVLAEGNRIGECLLPLDRGLLRRPALALSTVDVARVTHGVSLSFDGVPHGAVRLYDEQGYFVGLAEHDGQRLRSSFLVNPV